MTSFEVDSQSAASRVERQGRDERVGRRMGRCEDGGSLVGRWTGERREEEVVGGYHGHLVPI